MRKLSPALEPLETPIFRWVWMAALASNVGTWMQNVGAAWLMTKLSASPMMVALVQTATTLPVFLLGVPAGAIADLMDRRKLLLITQGLMLAAAMILSGMTFAGWTGPWSLLWLTFALGLGTTLNSPAWQATVPQLVPRSQLAPAIALNSMQFNIARAIGPALGGLVIALWGTGTAFLLNAVSFLAVIFVLWVWKNDQQPEGETRGESVVSAMWAGFRYVRHSPELHAVLVRCGVFVFCASALWAMLPVVASQIHSTSSGYGVLLGCLGVGSVIVAGFFARLRSLVRPDRLVFLGTLLYVAATAGLGYFHNFGMLSLAMLGGGMAWMAVMSTFNVSAQIALPAWVRARALGFYILIFQGGLAAGSWIFGLMAVRWTTPISLYVSAAGMIAGLMLAWRYRLDEVHEMDLTPSMHWAEPVVMSSLAPQDGPVLVQVEYFVEPAREREFVKTIQRLGMTRRRDGAVRWGIFADTGRPGRYVESFLVESWAEHMRQHGRATMADREIQEEVNTFHLRQEPPEVTHYIARE
jgi:MFS family permease